MGAAKRLNPALRADTALELICHQCMEMKPVSEFHVHRNIARGVQYWCKACMRDTRRERRKTNPQDPVLTRKYKLKGMYNVTPEGYDALYEAQKGLCAICGDFREPWQPTVARKDRKRFLVVDHDHATGRIRGLLCTNCNCGIGQMRDNPLILWAAMIYLEAS
jgi:hypothetical protein